MTEFYFLICIITLFSIIQSIFGVGILLFGTPTLLLLDYSFTETLWLLLPCSLSISVIQVFNDYNLVEAKKRAVYLIIPSLIIGLTFVITFAKGINITRLAGLFLVMIGIIRFSKRFHVFLSSIVKKHIQLSYALIGVIHGVSNMGGGPLSIVMSTIYAKKEVIRANVAFIYLVLVLFQLLVLSIMTNTNARSEVILLIPITFLSYFITSKFIASKVNDQKYTFILNIIIFTYGVLAILK